METCRNVEFLIMLKLMFLDFATGVYTVVLTDENGNVGTQDY